MSPHVASLAEQLVSHVSQFENCLVAYSGGVDSAVVAKAAQLALGEQAVAVTGVSASLAAGELEAAQRIAAQIGIRHEVLSTDELGNPEYLQNAPDRCFHCKTELYDQLQRMGAARGIRTILNGANADDLSDFRPGTKAASQHAVRSPLAECGFTKATVRLIAQHWGIEAWDKPATPCLSSRVAYGLSITPERLARIDAAERLLRSLGFNTVRVRLHENELARLEVPLDALSRLMDPPTRDTVIRELRRLGFRYVTLDLEGFRSGSFKQLIPAETLTAFSAAGAGRLA
ncbi:MAG: ATP-dependent sacrificial sulfur transferase LarE [Planctomycetota bacterium]|nr:MAG: ATP-dependent sacrificial sulfur transferase LarE [Planctomycetota bacterium]